jgi:DNA-binding CsgD family transcriptional regulator
MRLRKQSLSLETLGDYISDLVKTSLKTGMKTPSPLEKLSEREKIVFLLLGSGKTTSEIARILKVKLKTIQSFCARIKQKLRLENHHQLLYAAIRYQKPPQPTKE